LSRDAPARRIDRRRERIDRGPVFNAVVDATARKASESIARRCMTPQVRFKLNAIQTGGSSARVGGVFLNFRRIDYKSRAKNSKLLSFVSRCVAGVAINLRL
jgi:hypothetical protein